MVNDIGLTHIHRRNILRLASLKHLEAGRQMVLSYRMYINAEIPEAA